MYGKYKYIINIYIYIISTYRPFVCAHKSYHVLTRKSYYALAGRFNLSEKYVSDQSTKIDLECGAISYNSELNTGYRWAIQKVRNIAARLPPEWRSLLIPQPCTESVEDRSKPTHRVGRGHRRQTSARMVQLTCSPALHGKRRGNGR
jgi:hypothetical protein